MLYGEENKRTEGESKATLLYTPVPKLSTWWLSIYFKIPKSNRTDEWSRKNYLSCEEWHMACDMENSFCDWVIEKRFNRMIFTDNWSDKDLFVVIENDRHSFTNIAL